jgi:hypothetical protein
MPPDRNSLASVVIVVDRRRAARRSGAALVLTPATRIPERAGGAAGARRAYPACKTFTRR